MKPQPQVVGPWVTFPDTGVLVPAMEPIPVHSNPIPVAYMEPLPIGCLTSDKLFSLARTLNRLESWYRRNGQKHATCLRLVQGARDGRITALVQVGDVTLKLQMKGDDWIVLGDALKVSD